MIIVIAQARIAPDQVETARGIVADMVRDTRLEAGCLAYSFAEDMADPGLIRIAEEWADEAALSAHFRTAHMAAFAAALGRLAPKEVQVRAFEARERAMPS